MEKKNLWIIAIVLILLIWKFNLGIFSVFTPSPQVLYQYTAIPYENGIRAGWWDTYPRIASSLAEINLKNSNYKFESIVSNIIETKQCLGSNFIAPFFDNGTDGGKSDAQFCNSYGTASNIKFLYIDNDGCPHYSFNYLFPISSSMCPYSCYNRIYQRCEGCNPEVKVWGSYKWTSQGCWNPGGDYYGFMITPQWQEKSVSDWGGMTTITTNPDGTIRYGCNEKTNIYRNGNLIDTQYSTNPQIKFYYDDGTFSSTLQENKGMAVQAVMIGQSWWYQTASTCYAYQNNYAIKFPTNSFIINVTSPKTSYIQGENILLNVEVINNIQEVFGKLEIDYEVPTIIGTKTSSTSQDINIPIGKSTFQYTIPTNVPVATLRVKPKLIVQFKTSNLNGLNYPFESGNLVDIHSKDRFDLGTVEEDWKEIQIIPQQIYYIYTGVPCRAGYTLNRDGTYCLSDAIKDLSCVIIGCPIDYTCESSGFCAQPIFVNRQCISDQNCIDWTGTIATKCSVDTGYCYNEIIYEKVIACISASDCADNCEGKTKSCVSNKCVYSGECVYKSCSISSDCASLSPCSGISYTCQSGKCIPSGKCIVQPTTQTIWDLLALLWSKFIQWLNSIFS